MTRHFPHTTTPCSCVAAPHVRICHDLEQLTNRRAEFCDIDTRVSSLGPGSPLEIFGYDGGLWKAHCYIACSTGGMGMWYFPTALRLVSMSVFAARKRSSVKPVRSAVFVDDECLTHAASSNALESRCSDMAGSCLEKGISGQLIERHTGLDQGCVLPPALFATESVLSGWLWAHATATCGSIGSHPNWVSQGRTGACSVAGLANAALPNMFLVLPVPGSAESFVQHHVEESVLKISRFWSRQSSAAISEQAPISLSQRWVSITA